MGRAKYPAVDGHPVLLPVSGVRLWTLVNQYGSMHPTWVYQQQFLPRLFETRELARAFRRELRERFPHLAMRYRVVPVIVRAEASAR